MNTLEMLKKINFAKHLKKLERKYKNKKILLYGMNEEFFTIMQNFDLSNLNIIGIITTSAKPLPDLALENGGGGYPIIKQENIKSSSYDIVLLTSINTFNDERQLYELDIKYDLLIPTPTDIKIQQCWQGGF